MWPISLGYTAQDTLGSHWSINFEWMGVDNSIGCSDVCDGSRGHFPLDGSEFCSVDECDGVCKHGDADPKYFVLKGSDYTAIEGFHYVHARQDPPSDDFFLQAVDHQSPRLTWVKIGSCSNVAFPRIMKEYSGLPWPNGLNERCQWWASSVVSEVLVRHADYARGLRGQDRGGQGVGK